MAGEVQIVVTSVAEQQQLLRAGRLRPLAMLVPGAMELQGVGNIPSAFDAYPSLTEHLPIKQAIGFAVLDSAPDDVKATLTEAFDTAMASEKVQSWLAENYYESSGASGDAAKGEFARLEWLFAWTLQELGAASVDPATLGIAEPRRA